MNPEEKYGHLKDILARYGKVLIAYSGGVDSTFLVKAAIDALGTENVLAFLGKSPTIPSSELAEAIKIAESLGVLCITRETTERNNPLYIANNTDRCYHCKGALLDLAADIAQTKGFSVILEGSNSDDLADYRPGRTACRERNVLSPLTEAGLTKNDIRDLSKQFSLPTHDKPSFACLATRIPYGTPITDGLLAQIDTAEAFIKSLGIRQVRVRVPDNVAKIEVIPVDFERIILHSDRIAQKFKEIGFSQTTLDLGGYRTGSMNNSL